MMARSSLRTVQSTKVTQSDFRPDSLLPDISDLLSGIAVPDGEPVIAEETPARDIFAVHTRQSWDKSIEARCNFEFRPRITPRAGLWFHSIWQKSLMGRTLTEIKSDPAEIPHFADAVSDFISKLLGDNLAEGHWAICTTPKRRHLERNFATLICQAIHSRTHIPFYEDVAFCKSRQRINAVFTLNRLPEQPTIIVFDDFVTTGSTLKGMNELLRPLGKNLLFIAGINNKL